MRLFNKKELIKEELLNDIEDLEQCIKNEFDIDMKNRTLEIAKAIIKKEEEMTRIQNIIDKIMNCDSFIVKGYEGNCEIHINTHEDDLKEYLTENIMIV